VLPARDAAGACHEEGRARSARRRALISPLVPARSEAPRFSRVRPASGIERRGEHARAVAVGERRVVEQNMIDCGAASTPTGRCLPRAQPAGGFHSHRQGYSSQLQMARAPVRGGPPGRMSSMAAAMTECGTRNLGMLHPNTRMAPIRSLAAALQFS